MIRHGAEPASAAFGHGSLWLAFRGSPPPYPRGQTGQGQLVRINVATLRVTGHWPIIGSPIGLAVTRRYVWVAGDVFDGKPPAYGANQVQQFTVGGALVHSYSVPGPVALVGARDSAWVEYLGTGDHIAVRRLHAGIEYHPIVLSATGAPGALDTLLAACPRGIYAMTVDDNRGQTLIDRISAGRRTRSVRLNDLGNSVLSCAPAGGAYLVVQVGAVDHLWRLAFGARGRHVVAVTRLPGYAFGLGSNSAGAPWIGLYNSDLPGASVHATGVRIWQLGARTLRPGRWVVVPVPDLLAVSVAAGHTLWTVSDGPADRWDITELTEH